MRNRIISALLAAVMVVSLGVAGARGASGEKTSPKNNEKTENRTDGDVGQEESEVVEPVAYAYEQELNVIDDNYRNYYEIFVYSYYDSDGDGIGDLKGVTEKLDYIADMGFNGIWLMPVMSSPTYHKYDVTDYCAVDEAYGTVDDFKELITGCHERGIRLIIDLVINHTSSRHPWFKAACEYLESLPKGKKPDEKKCPYVGYYNFSQKQESGTYYPVGDSEWYYEGSFWSEMPDLNLENKKLRKEIKSIADFWIALGVDGFRMDAAMHYDDEDAQANVKVLEWLYDYCREKNPDFYMVSEVWASTSAIAGYYRSGTPSMFNFATSGAEGDLVTAAAGTSNASRLVDAMVSYQELFSEMNPDYIDAPFLTNHDQPRVASNLQNDGEKLKLAAGLLMMMSGSPFVYYGEEIGMKSRGTKDENKRLPMFWSNKDGTGITAGPEDADKDVESSFPAVDEQQKEELSLWNYYKRAIRIRNENPEIARGKITKLDELCDGDQAAITKTYGGNTIGIVYNTSVEPAEVDLGGTSLEGMEIRGYLTVNGEAVTLEDGVLQLPPRSICIIK